mgnify:CR=1 FL=1
MKGLIRHNARTADRKMCTGPWDWELETWSWGLRGGGGGGIFFFFLGGGALGGGGGGGGEEIIIDIQGHHLPPPPTIITLRPREGHDEVAIGSPSADPSVRAARHKRVITENLQCLWCIRKGKSCLTYYITHKQCTITTQPQSNLDGGGVTRHLRACLPSMRPNLTSKTAGEVKWYFSFICHKYLIIPGQCGPLMLISIPHSASPQWLLPPWCGLKSRKYLWTIRR